MSPWRIVFMGTPDFAVPSLKALINSTDEVVGIFTQPDKPVGRGMKMRGPAVKQAVEGLDIPVFQPKKLREPEAVAQLKALKPDLVVVVAYGQILSQEVLDLPPNGCVNVHASLLPRWRGAAPLHRALLAGDPESGITIMQMDAGLDTGPILSMESLPIHNQMTGGELHDQLANLGGALLLKTLPGLKSGTVKPQIQPEEGVTYAKKLQKVDGLIPWDAPATTISRQILALNPFPGAYTSLEGQNLKIFYCESVKKDEDIALKGAPGEVVRVEDDGLVVACGEGHLRITELQSPGKRRMAASQWLRGHRIKTGSRLGH
ncbi:MAG: methionyl-tRNA formyltransferase [Magnetococcales bacterium]|nr:methionyl-tRNA formyltransferase [Magnetococcales bacterium]